MSRSILALATTIMLAASAWPPSSAHAQAAGGRSEIFAGSELEDYLRYQQSLGAIPLYPWSIRAFSPHELDRMLMFTAAHPWQARYDLTPDGRHVSVQTIRPTLETIWNSAFPYGSNDGPVWAGKGLTAVVQAGVAYRAGPLSFTLAPEIFRAQNASFRLMSNGDTGRLVFADGQFPNTIDKPQRFGAKPYTVFDLGQSTIRLDVSGAAIGLSTANQTWGPATRYA